MTVGKNGKPLMVNVSRDPDKPMWVDADALDGGDVGNDFWAGVANGGQLLTLAEIAAINGYAGKVIPMELPE